MNKTILRKYQLHIIVKQPDAINFECEPDCLPIGNPYVFSYAVSINVYEKVMNCKIIIKG